MHEGPLVVFSGGGTGGHLYPALAIADALRERRPDVRALFLGAERGLEARVLPSRGEQHYLLPVHGVDRTRPLDTLRAVAGLAVSLVRVARIFARHRPEVVVVTGGYAGAPAGIVAGLTGLPLVLQEQNSVPGKVTRLLTRWASRIHVAFPEAIERLPLVGGRARVTGNPVRAVSGAGRDEARARYGVPADASLLLIVGGSQGSRALNRVMNEALQGLAHRTLDRPDGLHMLWATGPNHFEAVSRSLEGSGSPDWVHAVPYIDDMPDAIAAADLAVCRAGAMFTAELLNHGLPALLVPLPSAAADHQTHNARALESAGAAVVASESNLTGDTLWGEVTRLLTSPDVLAAMRESALARARPDAAVEIAADVEALLSAPEGAR